MADDYEERLRTALDEHGKPELCFLLTRADEDESAAVDEYLTTANLAEKLGFDTIGGLLRTISEQENNHHSAIHQMLCQVCDCKNDIYTRTGFEGKPGKRAEYQRRIAEALKQGDVKKASAIRREMYREIGEHLEPEDREE